MGTILQNLPRLTVFGLLALAASISGALPPERLSRGETPTARPSTGGGYSSGVRSFSTRPMPRGEDSSRPSGRGVMVRNASPMPKARLDYYAGSRIIIPPALERCTAIPTFAYWSHRDILAEIQWMSRRGFIPVTPMGDAVDAISDFVQKPAGWRAYGISVPAGGTMQVEVEHEKLGWFRLMLVDKWGQPGPGMMQAAIAHQPVMVTYKNPGKDATAVYVIVDDPAWWSDAQAPYTLQVRRDWDPAKTDLSQVKMVAGLWGASPSVSAEFRGPSMTGPALFPH